MEINLSYEKRFLDLLGYEYVDEAPNRWKVLDDNKKEVGYIEVNINPDKDDNPYNERSEYIYHMVIDSDTIDYDYKREFDDQIYFFDVKDAKKDTYDVFMQLGKKWFPGCEHDFLTIYNKKSLNDLKQSESIHFYKRFGGFESGIINAHTKGIGVDYCYPINGYIVREEMWFRNKPFDESSNWFKAYEYKLHHHLQTEDYSEGNGYVLFSFSMFDKPDKLITTKRILEKLSERVRKEEELNAKDVVVNNNIIHLFMNTIRRVFNIKPQRKVYVPQEYYYPTDAKTPEEFAIEHGRGIELFKQTRELANQILPFKKDIIYDYYKDYINEYGLNILFDQDEKEKTK